MILVKKNQENQKNKKTANTKPRKRWKYHLLTILLIVFLAQLIWGVIINSAKIYSLKTKVIKLEKIDKIAKKKNQHLREELEKYSSNQGVEALARNRLQFSKEDETLIIIKNIQE